MFQICQKDRRGFCISWGAFGGEKGCRADETQPEKI